MLDGMQRDIAHHFGARDSVAFPRPKSRVFVTAADGGTLGLHRPGVRIAAGGHAGDRALRDATREEVESARDRYIHDISNAWRHRDEWPKSAEDDDAAETEARAGAIRNALLSRGHSPDDVEDYLNDLDDDDLFDNDIGEHIAAFESSNNNNNNNDRARRRLDELYRQRDVELTAAWKHNK
jgi:hypothetical protein